MTDPAPNDDYNCSVCGERLIPLSSGYWACMDLSHGRLKPLGHVPRKHSVQLVPGIKAGNQIARHLKALRKLEGATPNGQYRKQYNGYRQMAERAGLDVISYATFAARLHARRAAVKN